MLGRGLLDLACAGEMDVAVTLVDAGAAEPAGRFGVLPQRRIADLVNVVRHGPRTSVLLRVRRARAATHWNAPVHRPEAASHPQPFDPRRRPQPRHIPEVICRRIETWKCGQRSYIWTITETTSGNGILEDRRHVDAHSSLDRDRPPSRPRRPFAIWSCEESWARSDHVQPVEAYDAARALTLAVDRIARQVAGCDRYQHGDLRRADRRRGAPNLARGAADRLGAGRQRTLFRRCRPSGRQRMGRGSVSRHRR